VAGEEKHELVVPVEGAGKRLDVWLAGALPQVSRARLQALIEEGRVRVDGNPPRSSTKVRAGQTVCVLIPAPVEAVPTAEDIPVDVVYEDAHLLVVNKPAGLVVHPGAGTPRGTLVNALLRHVRDLSGVGGVLRPGIVHRLDRGTSGLLVVAKNDAAHRALAAQFAGRTVEKEYLALVVGVPRARTGELRAPIGRDPVHRKRMSIRSTRGREARTSWRLEEAFDGAALLRVRIHTGRTHQIRVHLAAAGHPVAGDTTYQSRREHTRRAATGSALRDLSRPALHAARLAFVHPATGQRMTFEAPLPPDLEQVLAQLRAASRRALL
jgi:23S rRNA pseudouridine1911/1915/1917 synthase